MMNPISTTTTATTTNDDDDDDDDGYTNTLLLNSKKQPIISPLGASTDNDDDNDKVIEEEDDGLSGGMMPPGLASTSSSSSDDCFDIINGGDGNRAMESSLFNSSTRLHHHDHHHHSDNNTTNNTNINNNNNGGGGGGGNNVTLMRQGNNNNIGQPITPLHNIPYVHGGYAAAAPLFVTHSKFASVLKRLLPGAYVELKGLLQRGDDDEGITGGSGVGAAASVGGGRDLLREYSVNNDLIDHSSGEKTPSRSSSSPLCNDYSTTNSNNNNNKQNITITDPVKIMKWAENNPIVSAFGIWNSDNGRRTKRFMQGVVVSVVKEQHQQQQQQQQGQVGQVGERKRGTVKEGRDRERRSWCDDESFPKKRDRRKDGIETASTGMVEERSKRRLNNKDNNSNNIDEEHLTSLLRSLSTNTSASSEFDLFHRDRGNSSVVEAVTNTNGGTQQRLLRRQQQQQQQQRKREMNHSSSSSSLPPLPPPPPPPISNSTRRRSATPPPGSSLLKGGGMSGPGGVSSPRRKIPFPSDLPNSTVATAAATATEGGLGTNEHGSSSSSSGINNSSTTTRTRSRSLSLTNTSYDAYLNDHHRLLNNQYTRQRSATSSSSSNGVDHHHHHHLNPIPELIPQKQCYNKPAIEWDIFLDPQLVRLVDVALTVVDDLEFTLHKIRMKRERIRQQKRKEREEKRYHRKKREELMKRMRMNGGGFGGGVFSTDGGSDEYDGNDVITGIDDDEDFDLLQSHTAAQVEVDRLVAQLMRRTIIAHGSMGQLVLEGLGWAPEYNFGRVVKSSREGTNLPSPQRRNGHHHNGSDKDLASLSFSQSLSWDEEEEQRDFEALLDRRIHSSSVAATTGGGTTTTGKGGSNSSSGTHHSKGMFMEKWLSLFAKSLSLLVRSTNSSSGGDTGEEDSSSNNVIVKLSSSSSSESRRRKKNADTLLAKKKKKCVTKKPEERGLTSYLSSFFLNPDKSSSVDNTDEEESDNEQESDTNDDDASAHLTNSDMFSPAATTTKSGIFGGFSCGMSLCLGMDDGEDRFYCGKSTGQTSNSVFPLNPHASHQMARDIQRIYDVLGEPLRLVLDLKSRRVPPRVWSRLIDNLRSRGLIIEGIGSFDVDELRVIGKGCSYPLTPILFFHSVGDLQRACHANEVKKGDTVYFNGGSLMWKRSGIMEAAECGGCCGKMNDVVDDNAIHVNAYERTSSTATAATTSERTLNANGDYSFQPYAYPRSALSDWERIQCKSTIEDYRRHFDLKIGVYVQGETISFYILRAFTQLHILSS